MVETSFVFGAVLALIVSVTILTAVGWIYFICCRDETIGERETIVQSTLTLDRDGKRKRRRIRSRSVTLVADPTK
jgi:hypothetical protein